MPYVFNITLNMHCCSCRNEYYLTDLSIAPSQNVLKQTQEPVPMETDETEAVESVNVPEKSGRKILNEMESDTGAADEEDVQNVRRNTRSGKVKADGTEGNGNSVRMNRVRTRSQCSVDNEINESKTPNKVTERKLRTRGRKHSGDSDLASNKEMKKENVSRVRTRSMDVSENDIALGKGKVGESKKFSPVRKMRTRSSKIDSSDDEMFKDDDVDDEDDEEEEEEEVEKGNEDEVESDDDDDDVVETGDNKQGKRRLSAIHESDDEMGVDKIDDGEDNVEVTEMKERSKGDKSSRQDEGKTVIKKQRKAAAGSLLVQLELFAKFKDPKSMYMEPQLRQLYFDVSLFFSLFH